MMALTHELRQAAVDHHQLDQQRRAAEEPGAEARKPDSNGLDDMRINAMPMPGINPPMTAAAVDPMVTSTRFIRSN
ncbi:hypothetical protein [Bradyrhizobium sp. CCBAU 53415]|uniref:hypothetical protein n=1 Tax=Bradyrhizobium sp. CCBAU 53415 TaxID=1325119 RepID=UPI0023068304|nr:hypothetical protein [Bradyrhizobium sp. CCBAU 53415]MDA9465961.1 hypothetical protein [Bradyrhizobium sp. CCBAU 53415]